MDGKRDSVQADSRANNSDRDEGWSSMWDVGAHQSAQKQKGITADPRQVSTTIRSRQTLACSVNVYQPLSTSAHVPVKERPQSQSNKMRQDRSIRNVHPNHRFGGHESRGQEDVDLLTTTKNRILATTIEEMAKESKIQRLFALLVLCTFGLASAQPDALNLTDPVLGEHVDWLLEQMNANGTATVNETVYEGRFSTFFRDAAPLETLNGFIGSYQAISDSWAVMQVVADESSSAALLVAPIDNKEPVLLVSISIDESDGRVNGLIFEDGDPSLEVVPETVAQSKAVNLTDPVLGAHMDWLLGQMNSNGTSFNQSEYEGRFSTFFRDAAPLETLTGLIGTYQAISDSWAVVQVVADQSSSAALLVAPIDKKEPVLLVSISIDESDGRVNGLFFQDGDPSLEVVPETVKDTVAELKNMGHSFNYIVAEAENECNVLAGEGWEDPAPMGSMFKFWVLGAVVDAIEEGLADWDQNVTVTEVSKSLPSGVVQNDVAGSNRTVRELAELMISISDNTATDLLLELVGRENVEQALVDYGHHDPTLNIPFLKTKELFTLKLYESEGNGEPGPLGKEYINGTQLERRALLDSLNNKTIASYALNLATWAGGPIAINDLEWFGSPLDLCRVMTKLVENEDAARILAMNPGIPDESGIWSYIGFKGGSEPGVLGMAWYLVPSLNSSDTTHRVVTGTLWDPNNTIDETKAVLLLGTLRDLSLSENLNQTTTSGNELDEEPESKGSKAAAAFWLSVLSVSVPLLFCFI